MHQPPPIKRMTHLRRRSTRPVSSSSVQRGFNERRTCLERWWPAADSMRLTSRRCRRRRRQGGQLCAAWLLLHRQAGPGQGHTAAGRPATRRRSCCWGLRQLQGQLVRTQRASSAGLHAPPMACQLGTSSSCLCEIASITDNTTVQLICLSEICRLVPAVASGITNRAEGFMGGRTSGTVLAAL